MSTVSHDVEIKLRDLFVKRFTIADLENLAFALEIDFEDIPGSTKSAKARELAGYLNRRGLMDKLKVIGPQERSELPWDEVFGNAQPIEPVPPPSPPNPISPRDLQTLVSIIAAHSMFQTPSGRHTVMVLSGVDSIVIQDLNGPAYDVASSLLIKLNNYGEISPGDTAIGRLLVYISADPALPPAHKDSIATIAAKYGITLG